MGCVVASASGFVFVLWAAVKVILLYVFPVTFLYVVLDYGALESAIFVGVTVIGGDCFCFLGGYEVLMNRRVVLNVER